MTGRSSGRDEVDTVYFGGGTPSVLEPSDIGGLIEKVRECYALQESAEITMEINPGTVDVESLISFQRSGITRVSAGVQSFDDDVLISLGRIHSRRDVDRIMQGIDAAGFQSYSIDLMFAFPGQTPEDWDRTLQEALAFHPPHISVYCLTAEEGSPLGDSILRGEIDTPSDEQSQVMYQRLCQTLSGRGYEHYEISNFALDGHRCLHNWRYWSGGEYSGFGSSASSYERRWRFTNLGDPFDYMERIETGGSAVNEGERLSPERQMGEYVVMALRTCEGVSLNCFLQRFGVDLNELYGDVAASLLNDGYLIEIDAGGERGRSLRIPEHHLFIASEIALRFL
jgi:oxygen-independent coproporphyrinogen-3 oxidase